MRILWLGICLCVLSCTGESGVEIPEEIAALENVTVVEPDAEPIHQSEPQKVAAFGDTEEVIIGQIGPFVVDQNGYVYISDRSRQVIHKYAPDGTYRAEFGGEGDGPGEFRQLFGLQHEGDELHVLDIRNFRISTFSTDNLNLIRDITVPFEYEAVGGYAMFPNSFYITDPEHFLVHFGVSYASGEVDDSSPPTVKARLLNREEEKFLDGRIYEFPASEALVRRDGTSIHVMGVDYKRESHIMVNGQHIIHGWSEELLFKLHNHSGEYEGAIYQPYEKAVLNRDEILRQYADRDEPWRSMVRNDDIPEQWPAFYEVVADDEERIWVALFTDDDETYQWRVYSLSGDLVSTFTWPRSRSIRQVRDGYVYTLETDEETGLQEIAKYETDW